MKNTPQIWLAKSSAIIFKILHNAVTAVQITKWTANEEEKVSMAAVSNINLHVMSTSATVVVFVFIYEVALIFRYDTIWNLMSSKIYAFQSIILDPRLFS
jgi:hypothetical protein